MLPSLSNYNIERFINGYFVCASMTNYQIEGPIGSMHAVARFFERRKIVAERSVLAIPGEAREELQLTNGARVKGFYDDSTQKDIIQFSEGVPPQYIQELEQRLRSSMRETPEAVPIPSREDLEDII